MLAGDAAGARRSRIGLDRRAAKQNLTPSGARAYAEIAGRQAAQIDVTCRRQARRKNLAAWMQRLYKSEGMHDAALKMIYRVATGGKTMPEPKR